MAEGIAIAKDALIRGPTMLHRSFVHVDSVSALRCGGGSCSPYSLDAREVTATLESGSAQAMTGGQITDGKYNHELKTYMAVATTPRRRCRLPPAVSRGSRDRK